MPLANTKHGVFALYDMNVAPGECWRWKGAWGGRDRTKRPYYQYDGKRGIAYRVVYSLVHGVDLTSDQLIRHTCDNGGFPVGCGCPDHILLGNNTQNMEDMMLRSRHGMTRHMLLRIRKLLAEGRHQDDIAELYGISQATVSAVNTKKTYSLIPDEEPTSEPLEPIEVKHG